MPQALIASIPSPPTNTLGPFNLYGLCIALGVIAAVVISSKRWEARGGDPDDIATIAMWAVPAGVIGARIYHVITDWKMYRDEPIDALKITQGGLGIPGGIFLGVVVGYLVARRLKMPLRPMFDVVAPALPVAQAIGRLGNYFNQEVFGRPTDLAWGLEVEQEFRPDAHRNAETFHPTFLYEGLWNVALAVVIVRLDRRRILPPGLLFTIYVIGYGLGRLWIENLRSDNASLLLGLRVNIWMSLAIALIALAVLVMGMSRAPLHIPEAAHRNTALVGGADAADLGAAAAVDAEVDVDADAEGADEPDDGDSPSPEAEPEPPDQPVADPGDESADEPR